MAFPTASLEMMPALLVELEIAFARWSGLCQFMAQQDGVGPEEFAAEMSWADARFQNVRAAKDPAHIQEVIAGISRAEAWMLADAAMLSRCAPAYLYH